MKCRQHVILQDTAGCFKLAIRISREYRPTEAHHRAQKKWRDNKDNKEHFNKRRRKWRKNLPKEKKDQYRL
jgi:predicted RNA-binding protein with RPS1 domain